MRAVGVDLGTVRVGIAVSDELGLLAHPRPHLDGRDRAALIGELCRLAAAEGIDLFVVGLPTRLDGRESASTRRARSFAVALAERSGKRVELTDERWTTVEARRRLREGGVRERQGRQRIDSAAAAVLLQAWMDAHRVEAS
ncbi:MAG: Holliday junction resolvase RuvX [Polyangiaceae bacterium]|nr:Holliday junction resolvase RuvX [Polyangiaceae bacterium]